MIAHPTRAGWVCQSAPGGGYVCWPADNKPHIQMNHIDGPLLHFRNGELHWLTLWERVMVRLGRADAYSLERKHRPLLATAPEINRP